MIINKTKKQSIFQSCVRGKSFLWFSEILSRRQKTKIIKERQNLLKKLTKKKNLRFSEGLRNRKLLGALYGGLSKTFLKNLKFRSSKARRYQLSSTTKNTLLLLEMRLDSCLFRMNFCSTFRQARQWIRHGRVLVNWKRVESESYQLKPGDVISLTDQVVTKSFREKVKNDFLRKQVRSMKPSHIEINYSTFQGVVLFPPQQLYYPSPLQIPKKNLPCESLKTKSHTGVRSLKIRGFKLTRSKKVRNSGLWNRFFLASRRKRFPFFSPSLVN